MNYRNEREIDFLRRRKIFKHLLLNEEEKKTNIILIQMP